MKIRVRHQIHSYLIEIYIKNPLKSHRTGQIRQQISYNSIHLVIGLLILPCYLTPFQNLLLSAFILISHLFHSLDYIAQRLVIYG